MGLAKGVGAKLVSNARPVMGGLAAGAVEVVGGGLGEVGGRVAAGQEMDIKEIGFEAFAGLGSAPVTFGSQLGKIGKSIDRVKSQKILEEFTEKKLFLILIFFVKFIKISVSYTHLRAHEP